MPSAPSAGGGAELVGFEALANPFGAFETVKAGGGEEDGVDLAFFQFAEASIDVATEFYGFEIGTEGFELGAAALAAGTDFRSQRESGEAFIVDGDENVARVDTAGRGSEFEAFGQLCGQVFEGVDGEIDFACGESFFNLLGEHAFGCAGFRCYLGEGDGLEAVAGGLDDFDFDGMALIAEKAGDVVGLPESELGAAAADAKVHLRDSAVADCVSNGCSEGSGDAEMISGPFSVTTGNE